MKICVRSFARFLEIYKSSRNLQIFTWNMLHVLMLFTIQKLEKYKIAESITQWHRNKCHVVTQPLTPTCQSEFILK